MKFEMSKQPKLSNIIDLLIGMPTLDSVKTETVASITAAEYPTLHDFMLLKSAVVSDQRDRVAQYAIKNNKRIFTHLLFIDSDITFPPDAITKLLLDEKDIVSGLYYKKTTTPQPVAWTTEWLADGSVKFKPLEGKGDLIECGAVGMGFCLIKTKVLKDVANTFHTCFQHMNGMGEDLSFCIRAQQLGYKIYVDTTFKLGHIGAYNYDGGTR